MHTRKDPASAMRLLALAAALLGCSAGHADPGRKITGIAPVAEVEVPNGTLLVDALAKLPRTVTLTANEGEPVTAEVTWNLSESVITARGNNTVRQLYLPTIRGSYEMTGSFALPAGFVRTEQPLTVKALVGIAAAPLARLDDKRLFDQPGKYVSESLKFGSVERTYHYYVPSRYNGRDPLPVMFTFHGGGSYAIGQLAYSDFDVVAERRGFIVVAPDYGASALGTFQTPGVAELTSAIIDALGKKLRVDNTRIYASGISMGGSASFTLAHELGNKIAAVAPVASSARGILERKLPRPTTIVWFYGTRDSSFNDELLKTLDHLVAQNKAAARPSVKTWTPTKTDPTGITRLTYDGGINDTEVVFYRIDEGGHTWPGKYQYSSLINVGLTSQHIDASDVIWEHLSKHRLPRS